MERRQHDLLDQMEQDHPFRVELDDSLLEFLEMEDSADRGDVARMLRRGVFEAIDTLRHTMQ
jgi:hypothetical protein